MAYEIRPITFLCFRFALLFWQAMDATPKLTAEFSESNNRHLDHESNLFGHLNAFQRLTKNKSTFEDGQALFIEIS